MKYMLTIIGSEGGMEDATPEQMSAVMDSWTAYTDELTEAGAFIAGEGLQPSPTATTVRVGEGGERLLTDGPYAETKEQVGGFYLIDCANLDEALEWAKKAPNQDGGIEVRPVIDYEQFASADSEAREGAVS